MTSLARLGALGLGALLALGPGCGKNDVQPDSGTKADTRPATDFTSVPDTGPAACGPTIYPCAPYGTKTNDVAANLDFLGFQDPEEQCEEHKTKTPDYSKLSLVAFKDFFLGDPKATCKRKLLWVIVSAGWCGPCQKEVKSTALMYAKGQVDARIGILNIVFETDTPGTPADEAFTKDWSNALGPDLNGDGKADGPVTFPVVMDPGFKMGAYFNKAATPFNMLVDLSNMQIFYQLTGGDANAVGPKITEFLNK
jgi:thiol-disulfide isomerase/thioredoxin